MCVNMDIGLLFTPVSSYPPVAILFELGESITLLSVPCSFSDGLSRLKSHGLTFPSSLPLVTVLPFGDNAMVYTPA